MNYHMRFAHFADCHIGGWKEEKLKKLNMDCFKKAIQTILERQVDFVVLAGDLFNTAIPQIDYIKEATAQLKKLKDNNIPVYAIAGSHDYSPSGKTMLDVLEKAGLLINVMKFNEEGDLEFTVDPKTQVKLTGIIGKKGGLEINDYKLLDTSNLEKEEGFKIFLFHTAINEFKPKGLEKMPGTGVATLPENFQYYAGGHVHYIFQKEFGKGVLTFPGALFPNNFKEMEEWQHGGIYIVDEQVNWEYVPIKLKDVVTFRIDVTAKTPEQAEEAIIQQIKTKEIIDKIVTLRIVGDIQGKTSELKFGRIYETLKEAYFVLRNTSKMRSIKNKEILTKIGSVEEIEEEMIKEANKEGENKTDFTKALIQTLDKEKVEGEKVADFEKRIVSETMGVLQIED
jgi:DNA repair protein SbcD/Mre11